MRYSSILVFALSGMIAFCADDALHFPTNEDLRLLRGISSPILSPDGKTIVAVVQDNTASGGGHHIWLLNLADKTYRQLVWPDLSSNNESDPQFLHDGESILFMTESKLLRARLDGTGTTVVEVSNAVEQGNVGAPPDVEFYELSPDGKTIAVVASDTKSQQQKQEEAERRDVIRVDDDARHNHIFLIDTTSWKSGPVPNLIDVDAVAWSMQSDRLLVLTHTRPPRDGFSTAGWIVELDNPSAQTKVDGLPNSTRKVAWLHNGKQLILFAQSKEDAPVGTSDLYKLDLGAGKLTHFPAGARDSTLSPRTLLVAKDDRTALVSLTHGVRRTVGRVNLETGQLDILDLGAPVISDFSQQSDDSDKWVYVSSSSTSLPAVYVATRLSGTGTRVAQPDMAPTDWQAAPPRVVSWERSGMRFEGLLYLPPGKADRIPMVVIAHGGPSGQFTDTYMGLTNLLVGKGWAIFLPNPRGSTGYGIAFEAANKADLGNGDLLDIMAGIDKLIRIERIDPERLAMIGHSYGGTMAAFAAGKTSRFKAIVCSAPVTDQISAQGTADPSYPDEWFTGVPWIHFQAAWRQSPLAYAKSVSAPVLLVQGEGDTTDPPGQSQQFYYALREQGVPVQMLLFPREDHGSMRRNFMGEPSTEPWHGVILRDEIVTFVERGFRGELGRKRAFREKSGSDVERPELPRFSRR